MMRLGKKDKQVIKAFVEQNGMLGHKLYSNGTRLDGLWMGGQGLAVWRNGKIDLPDSGSRSGQLVQNAVRRAAAKVDIRGKTKTKNPNYEEFMVSELEAMPTLSSGHMHDLKHDDGRRRYWLSRMSIEDGEEYAIYVEELQDGRWVDVHQYGEPSGYDEMFGNPHGAITAELIEVTPDMVRARVFVDGEFVGVLTSVPTSWGDLNEPPGPLGWRGAADAGLQEAIMSGQILDLQTVLDVVGTMWRKGHLYSKTARSVQGNPDVRQLKNKLMR
jgi:hypothetical protein